MKSKNNIGFAASHETVSKHPEQRQWPHQELLPWDLHSASSPIAFNLSVCICPLSPCILCIISKICFKAIASSLYITSAYERFHRNVLLSNSGGTYNLTVTPCQIDLIINNNNIKYVMNRKCCCLVAKSCLTLL